MNHRLLELKSPQERFEILANKAHEREVCFRCTAFKNFHYSFVAVCFLDTSFKTRCCWEKLDEVLHEILPLLNTANTNHLHAKPPSGTKLFCKLSSYTGYLCHLFIVLFSCRTQLKKEVEVIEKTFKIKTEF